MNYDYKNIVAKIMDRIYEFNPSLVEENELRIEYIYNGFTDYIYANGVCMFNSDDYEIDTYFNEENNEYISEEDFIDEILNEIKWHFKKINDDLKYIFS